MNRPYAYKTIFTINSQNALDDFWSYLIFRLNLEHSEDTYNRFARLYNILSEHKTLFFEPNYLQITLEESSDKHYVSIKTNIKEFLKTLISRLKQFGFAYHYENGLLSYPIDKKMQTLHHSVPTKEKKYAHDFMENDDVQMMSDILDKMKEKNFTKNYQTFELEELDAYRTAFSNYSNYLKYYSELHTINNIVAELSVILSLYKGESLALEDDFRVLLYSFLNNLILWHDKLFVQGSEQIDFMDETLRAELDQIKIVLNLYDEVDEEDLDLDDIFEI